MEGASVEGAVWRVQVWRVQCGGCSVEGVSVEGAVCGHKVLTREVIGRPVSVSVLEGSGAGSLPWGGSHLAQHLQMVRNSSRWFSLTGLSSQ